MANSLPLLIDIPLIFVGAIPLTQAKISQVIQLTRFYNWVINIWENFNTILKILKNALNKKNIIKYFSLSQFDAAIKVAEENGPAGCHLQYLSAFTLALLYGKSEGNKI